MKKIINNLTMYVSQDYTRDTQGLSYKDEAYKNFLDPNSDAYNEFEELWEECREVDIRGDVIISKETGLTPEEAIRVINSEDRSLTAIGMYVDIVFCNGKTLKDLDVEKAKSEIEKEENYYPIKIEVEDSETRYFKNTKDATEWLISEYCVNSEVVPGEMLACTTITGCSVEDVMEIAKNFLNVTD